MRFWRLLDIDHTRKGTATMGVKYSCTKCDKRFVDWGAEKIKAGEGCDDCKGEFLELVGFDAAQAAPKKKPSLTRKRAAAAKRPKRVAAKKARKSEPDVAAELRDDAVADVANLDGGGTDASDGVYSDAGGSEPD